MKVGYACLTLGVPYTNQKSCVLRNATEANLRDIIGHNLNSLENIIDYNIENNILLFRISSDLIPFGSSPVNNLKWWDIFETKFKKIGEKISRNSIRVSMHPGQYTVLNSTREEVVENAIKDLLYHNKVLDCLGVGQESKIILHIGGIYNDKEQAIKRFIDNYKRLDISVRNRLVIENDDKSYNINDLLEISNIIDVPVVYDNLHNKINPYDKSKSDNWWIHKCKKTWKEKDGYQKIHFSQQDPLKKPGSHSQSINIDEFISFYDDLESKDIDIMLEVKDKNLSAIKCINTTSKEKNIKSLEIEWSRYKYKILENSPTDYLDLRSLLRHKENYPAKEFYKLIENALEKEIVIGNAINSASHVWGYFKDVATDKEKSTFLRNIEKYKKGIISLRVIKNFLWKLTLKYNQLYLLNSYYFIETSV